MPAGVTGSTLRSGRGDSGSNPGWAAQLYEGYDEGMGFRMATQSVTSADAAMLFQAEGADVQAWIQVQPAITTPSGHGYDRPESLPVWVGINGGVTGNNGFCLTAGSILEMGLSPGDAVWVTGAGSPTFDPPDPATDVRALIRFVGTDPA